MDLNNESKKRVTCVYCGKTIEKRSKEHIIQNALGGLYESDDICCRKCNNLISDIIDVPFTKTFNAIISHIPNFTKTNKGKSKPSCSGHAIFEEAIYPVIIRDGKVVSCRELSKKEKRTLSKTDFCKFQVISYDIPIDNISFKNGLSKIAFNYALDSGIDSDMLLESLDIELDKGEVRNISFNNILVPFYPLNPLDVHLELKTEFELYHNLILFSQENYLWCYVDLFNTFQYYILLTDKWNEDNQVHRSYFQYIQKIDRTIENIYIHKPKHMRIYAQMYNVEPTLDLTEFNRRLKIAIQKESQKKGISEVLSWKMLHNYLNPIKMKNMSRVELVDQKLKYIPLYFDANDSLIEENFRTVTIFEPSANEIASYPLLIHSKIISKEIEPRVYTYSKFDRLNHHLLGYDSLKKIDGVD